MRAAGFLAIVLLALAACESEPPYPVRPPGGGSGDNDPPPDAEPADAANGGALTGRICVVDQLDLPFECPAIAQARDVLVEAGTASVESNQTGEFTLDLDTSSTVLRIAAEVGDTLLTTEYRVSFTTARIDVPAVSEGAWTEA